MKMLYLRLAPLPYNPPAVGEEMAAVCNDIYATALMVQLKLGPTMGTDIWGKSLENVQGKILEELNKCYKVFDKEIGSFSKKRPHEIANFLSEQIQRSQKIFNEKYRGIETPIALSHVSTDSTTESVNSNSSISSTTSDQVTSNQTPVVPLGFSAYTEGQRFKPNSSLGKQKPKVDPQKKGDEPEIVTDVYSNDYGGYFG
jgi:hypothetical protein